MKKIIALILVLCISLCLVACKKEGTSSDLTSDALQTEILDTESEVLNEDATTEGTDSEDKKTDTDSKPESKPTTNITSNSTPTSSTEHTHEFSKATCTEPAKCSCGATEGAALGHKYADYRCTVCKEAESGYKAADSTDGSFYIVIPESIYSKCDVQALTDADGVQVAVKGASFGKFADNAPAFVYTYVHNSQYDKFESDWKGKGDGLVFEQSSFITFEQMGFKLERVATKGDFGVYCQYIDPLKADGNLKEVLDKKSEIKIIFK